MVFTIMGVITSLCATVWYFFGGDVRKAKPSYILPYDIESGGDLKNSDSLSDET